MFFIVQKPGIGVELGEDGGDVNIIANGYCVAWFGKDEKKLIVNRGWLQEVGLELKVQEDD